MTELALLNTTVDMYMVLAACIMLIAKFAGTEVLKKAKDELLGSEIISMAMLAPLYLVQWAPYEAVEAIACTLVLQENALLYRPSWDDKKHGNHGGTIVASTNLLRCYMHWSYLACGNDEILCGCAMEHVNNSATAMPKCVLLVSLLEAFWHQKWQNTKNDKDITTYGVFHVGRDSCCVVESPKWMFTTK
jgi:hypothetical protein